MEALAIGLIAFTTVAVLIALFSFFSKKKEPTRVQKDLFTLEGEIKKLKTEGLMDETIIKRLSDAGWDEHVAELATHDLRKPNHKLEKLQAYVDSRIRKGDDKEMLKETLVEAGWSEDVVDLVLKLD